MTVGLKETTELQTVDFALGYYISGAFAGFADAGPQAWRDFIKRPVNKQIFRHEADTPAEFIKDFTASQKNEVREGNTAKNAPLLPVVHYFRRPGIVNTMDQRAARRKVYNGNKRFNLRLLNVALDYNLVFIAWDKLTLDKLLLAWGFHVAQRDRFTVLHQIAGEIFEGQAFIQDNTNVALQNGSDIADGKRFYAATTPLTVQLPVLLGHEIDPPGLQRLIFGWDREADQQYAVAGAEGSYLFSSADKGEPTAINPGTLRVTVGGRSVATDDGNGRISGEFLLGDYPVSVTGTVDYYNGSASWTFSVPPADTVGVAYQPLQGRLEYGTDEVDDSFWQFDDEAVMEFDDGAPIQQEGAV